MFASAPHRPQNGPEGSMRSGRQNQDGRFKADFVFCTVPAVFLFVPDKAHPLYIQLSMYIVEKRTTLTAGGSGFFGNLKRCWPRSSLFCVAERMESDVSRPQLPNKLSEMLEYDVAGQPIVFPRRRYVVPGFHWGQFRVLRRDWSEGDDPKGMRRILPG